MNYFDLGRFPSLRHDARGGRDAAVGALFVVFFLNFLLEIVTNKQTNKQTMRLS